MKGLFLQAVRIVSLSGLWKNFGVHSQFLSCAEGIEGVGTLSLRDLVSSTFQ